MLGRACAESAERMWGKTRTGLRKLQPAYHMGKQHKPNKYTQDTKGTGEPHKRIGSWNWQGWQNSDHYRVYMSEVHHFVQCSFFLLVFYWWRSSPSYWICTEPNTSLSMTVTKTEMKSKLWLLLTVWKQLNYCLLNLLGRTTYHSTPFQYTLYISK